MHISIPTTILLTSSLISYTAASDEPKKFYECPNTIGEPNKQALKWPQAELKDQNYVLPGGWMNVYSCYDAKKSPDGFNDCSKTCKGKGDYAGKQFNQGSTEFPAFQMGQPGQSLGKYGDCDGSKNSLLNGMAICNYKPGCYYSTGTYPNSGCTRCTVDVKDGGCNTDGKPQPTFKPLPVPDHPNPPSPNPNPPSPLPPAPSHPKYMCPDAFASEWIDTEQGGFCWWPNSQPVVHMGNGFQKADCFKNSTSTLPFTGAWCKASHGKTPTPKPTDPSTPKPTDPSTPKPTDPSPKPSPTPPTPSGRTVPKFLCPDQDKIKEWSPDGDAFCWWKGGNINLPGWNEKLCFLGKQGINYSWCDPKKAD